MRNEVGNNKIVVIVSEGDLLDSFTRLMQTAGIAVESSDGRSKVVNFIEENPFVILSIPENDEKGNIPEEIISAARKSSQASSCLVITSKKLAETREVFRKFSWRPFGNMEKQKTLEEVEKEYILNTLNNTRWRYKTAAKVLGINRSTLYRKIKKYKLSQTLHNKE